MSYHSYKQYSYHNTRKNIDSNEEKASIYIMG